MNNVNREPCKASNYLLVLEELIILSLELDPQLSSLQLSPFSTSYRLDNELDDLGGLMGVVFIPRGALHPFI